jgi:hypothetical protein
MGCVEAKEYPIQNFADNQVGSTGNSVAIAHSALWWS